MLWFTSDTHFGHRNILRHCPTRLFKSIEEMDEIFITNWNKLISPKDTVYVLGDFCLDSRKVNYYLSRLNGSQKFLIKGNHDDVKSDHQWTSIFDVYDLKISKTEYVWMSHYAHRVWPRSHYGAYHFFGHSHGTLPRFGKSCDVGVDAWNHCPINLEQAVQYLSKE